MSKEEYDQIEDIAESLRSIKESLILLAHPAVVVRESCTCGPEHHTGGFCYLHKMTPEELIDGSTNSQN